jgi:hypothetical protein
MDQASTPEIIPSQKAHSIDHHAARQWSAHGFRLRSARASHIGSRFARSIA